MLRLLLETLPVDQNLWCSISSNEYTAPGSALTLGSRALGTENHVTPLAFKTNKYIYVKEIKIHCSLSAVLHQTFLTDWNPLSFRRWFCLPQSVLKYSLKTARTSLYYAKKLCIKCCRYVFSVWMHNVLNTRTLQIVVLKKDSSDFLKCIFD